MRIPFGKHQDREMTDVPKSYLRWLRGQEWLGKWLAKEIDAVLNGEVASSDESFEETLETWKESASG